MASKSRRLSLGVFGFELGRALQLEDGGVCGGGDAFFHLFHCAMVKLLVRATTLFASLGFPA